MHRTTVRLDEHLLVRAKEYALERRTSLTAVIEEALVVHLARSTSVERPKRPVNLPISKQKGGFAPGVETWDDVKRVLEDEEIENFRRIEREDATGGR